jgi:hemoglobin-like flavoprotein
VAKRSYLRLQVGDTKRALFTRFYRNLFDTCPDVKERFAAIDMDRQYEILNRAIQLLLDFEPARGSEPLRDLASRHTPFGLNRRHYDLFLDVLVKTIEECGVNDTGQLAAWRKTLTPAVDFMWSCQGCDAQMKSAG